MSSSLGCEFIHPFLRFSLGKNHEDRYKLWRPVILYGVLTVYNKAKMEAKGLCLNLTCFIEVLLSLRLACCRSQAVRSLEFSKLPTWYKRLSRSTISVDGFFDDLLDLFPISGYSSECRGTNHSTVSNVAALEWDRSRHPGALFVTVYCTLVLTLSIGHYNSEP